MFEHLGRFLVNHCRDGGYVPTFSGNEPSERHGSWEWVFSKRGNGLTRFVSVSLTPSGPVTPTEPELFVMEFWSGAESRSRFVRNFMGQLYVKYDSHAEDQRQLGPIGERLRQVLATANTYSLNDLRESYSTFRPSRG
jgi:hypothetical protein